MTSSSQRFQLSPFALEMDHDEDGHWAWARRKLTFNPYEPDPPMVEVQSDFDGRTFGLAELLVDEPGEARFVTVNGTRCWARPFRPYDAVLIAGTRAPVALDQLEGVLFAGDDPPPEDPSGSILELHPDRVWLDDEAQRRKTREIAEVVAHDVRGRATIEAWRRHVPFGLLGWAPTKVPLKAANVGPTNARFVTPTVAEMLWRGERSGFRREHIVARSAIVKMWDEVGDDLEALARIIWDYRFAAVLTTIDEAKHIDRVGGRVGSTERYVTAGVPTVYDRLRRCDTPVGLLDPRHPAHAELELTPWD